MSLNTETVSAGKCSPRLHQQFKHRKKQLWGENLVSLENNVCTSCGRCGIDGHHICMVTSSAHCHWIVSKKMYHTIFLRKIFSTHIERSNKVPPNLKVNFTKKLKIPKIQSQSSLGRYSILSPSISMSQQGLLWPFWLFCRRYCANQDCRPANSVRGRTDPIVYTFRKVLMSWPAASWKCLLLRSSTQFSLCFESIPRWISTIFS